MRTNTETHSDIQTHQNTNHISPLLQQIKPRINSSKSSN